MMPCHWGDLAVPVGGRVRCRRRFGYPGQIDTYERVWLTLSGLSQLATLSLNGAPLGDVAEPAGEVDVTGLLQARNELVVDLEAAKEGAEVWDEVALEVRCTAYLRGVTVHAELREGRGEICATGEVVGQADAPLDLYLILGRSPLVETHVVAVPQGQAFRLTGGVEPGLLLAGDPVLARIELVNGAVVWYSWQVPVSVEQTAGG
jgi:hypothetical protein